MRQIVSCIAVNEGTEIFICAPKMNKSLTSLERHKSNDTI